MRILSHRDQVESGSITDSVATVLSPGGRVDGCQHGGMGTGEQGTWLNYAEAAARVKRSTHTIQLWRREGMPMQWAVDEGGQRYRVVEKSVLLSWFRQKMTASPVHFYKMRREAIDRGETPQPVPERFKRSKGMRNAHTLTEDGLSRTDPIGTPEDHDPTGDLTASDASPAPDSQDGDIGRPDPYVELLASLPEFVGQAEHAALVAAMEEHTPGCDGLETFARDRFSDPAELEMMRRICQECPLRDLCAAFAVAGRPAAGLWAGMTPTQLLRLDAEAA